jgi:hypothetical protein
MLGENAPQDWGIADKTEWVSDKPLSGEARLPALEGYDVVGFTESVDFAMGRMKIMPAHNGKPAHQVKRCPAGWYDNKGTCAQGKAPTQPTSPAQRMEQARKAGKWGGKMVAEKQSTPSKSQPEPKPKLKSEVKPESKPKSEPKPEPKPEPKSGVPEKKIQEQDVSSNPYALDQSSAESIKRVQEISSTPATDPRFRSGQVAFKQIDEYYSQASPEEESLSRLSAQGGNKIMNALINNADLDQKIEIKKKTFITPRDALKKAGLNTDDPEKVKNFVSLLKSLNSHLDSTGNWSTSPTHALAEGLGFFEAEHIQHRSDMANPDTSIADIRIKAFSAGADFEDSASWANMSPQEIDIAYHLLPSDARKTLRESGSPGVYYNPLSPDGQSRSAPDLRGRLALFMWAKQGGRDGYCLSGMQRSPGEFQVEHIQDMSSGGKDTASNFVMLFRRVNQPRSDKPLPNFVEFASRRAEEIEKNLSDPSGTFLQTRLRALRMRGIHDTLDKSNALAGTISSLTSPDFFKRLQKNSESLPESLRPSLDDFNKFVDELNSISDSDTKISSLSKLQIENLVSAIGNLGANPIKTKEYIGRAMFNNYHDGNRIVRSNGKIQVGRGGTNGAPAPLQALENRLIGRPEAVSPEDYQTGIALVSRAHENIRNARNSLIDREGGDSSQFHEILGQSLTTICGLDDNSPEWIRNNKINTDNLVKTIAGYVESFPPDRAVGGNLAKLYLSAALDSGGFSKEQFDNPDSIKKKTDRDKILKIKSILDKITGTKS